MSKIDVGIILFYFFAMLVIGLYANLKQNNVNDYFVAGGRLGTFSIACLWLASWVGGAAIVGGAAQAYELGITSIWYIGAMAIGCLLFGLFFAARVKRLGEQHDYLTYPEVMEARYDGRTRVVATITTIAAFTAYSAGQLAAAASILHGLLGWDYDIALLVATSVIVIYTASGGFLAVTYTDWVQFILLFIGIVIVGIPIAISQGGTWYAFQTELPATHFELGNWGWPTIIALVVSIVLSFFTAMDSYTRSFAARSAKVARRGALLAVIFLAPLAIGATWLGMTSALLFPEVDNSAQILSTFVVETFPTGLKGLVLVGILAALMSTADICILTASANFSQDIYRRHINPTIEAPKLLKISMMVSLVVGAFAAILAWKLPNVVDLLLIGFTINSAALFIPSIAMIYFSRAGSGAAFWSITCSLVTVLTWYIAASLKLNVIFELDPLWPGLVVSIVVFFILNRKSATCPS